MRLWCLSHRRPAKAQASLHICAVSLEPSLLAHIKCRRRRSFKGPTKNETSSPTVWLRMQVWRMSLRRTESAIISWNGSLVSTYAPDEWDPFNGWPFCMWTCNNGEFGTERVDRRLPISGSTSDREPLRFFFLPTNALLNELRNWKWKKKSNSRALSDKFFWAKLYRAIVTWCLKQATIQISSNGISLFCYTCINRY